MSETIRAKAKLFLLRFLEATAACLLVMVKGDVSALTASHWLTAMETGTLAGALVVAGSFTPLKRWLADPVAVALVVVLATTAADFLVHPDHYGNGSLEAILTGVGASGIYLAVTRWLAGGSSVLSAAPGDTGRPSIADKE
ncbi:MAG: hypothetical protein U1E46_07375 [Hyphomicrobiales bacterium]